MNSHLYFYPGKRIFENRSHFLASRVSPAPNEQNRQKPELFQLLGREVISLTRLGPAGYVSYEGIPYDALSGFGIIPPYCLCKVIEIRFNSLVVMPL